MKSKHKRMRKTNFAENFERESKSFVRSGIGTCDVFTANNQAVTKAVK